MVEGKFEKLDWQGIFVLDRIHLIRNVGNFHSVALNHQSVFFKRLVLIYSENGRGKTTICSILRSLASGNTTFLEERKRIGSEQPPHVVLDVNGETIIYENRVWTKQHPDLYIYDDLFVHENVYSGLQVDSNHRQNLHELIIGRHGVALVRRVQDFTQQITDVQGVIRQLEAEIPVHIRGGLSVDVFCVLTPVDGIEQRILDEERRIAALENIEEVQTKRVFEPINVENFDFSNIDKIVVSSIPDLDQEALEKVKNHFHYFGLHSEAWTEKGMEYLHQLETTEGNKCPFCNQQITDETMINHYRAYFGIAYETHKSQIKALKDELEAKLGDDALVYYQRQIEEIIELHRFWSKYVELPTLDVFSEVLLRYWIDARQKALEILLAKVAAPLEVIIIRPEINEVFERHSAFLNDILEKTLKLVAANESIQRVKLETIEGDLAKAKDGLKQLKVIQSRFDPYIDRKCLDYSAAKVRKESLVTKKETARIELDHHRNTIIPLYQDSINEYLRKFNANFRIVEVQATNPGGRPSSTYDIRINGENVNINGGRTGYIMPSFRSTLSGGDRNTLALAFFFASLDQALNLDNCTIVFDDPISSLDEGRSIVTAQEIRDLLARSQQVIVLSHSKQLLCSIWNHVDRKQCVSLEIIRCQTGSTITTWDVNDTAMTEYDRRHESLRSYLQGEGHNLREIAQSLRPIIEGYLRVVCPEYFPPGTLIGRFIEQARNGLDNAKPIISPADIQELNAINEYASRFHHDANPAWDTEVANINDTQLHGFVQRVIEFTRRNL